MKRSTLYLLTALCLTLMLRAQSFSPSVTNAGGNLAAVGSGSTAMEVVYSIGEPCMTTIANGNNMLTQGFLQPEFIAVEGLKITASPKAESCLGKSDGSILITAQLVGATAGSYTLDYDWLPAGTCANTTCSLVGQLAPGTYTVIVIAKNTAGTEIDRDTSAAISIAASNFPCQIQVYTGFTPNGDGKNDTWIIENIGDFPNKVSIFNRWGQTLQEIRNYDNVNNVWDGTEMKSKKKVSTGTYFYVIELDNGATRKGWVEVTATN